MAFSEVDTSEGFMPGVTLSGGEMAEINFGQSNEELCHYGLVESQGYLALCSPQALQYNIPLWYSSHGGFLVLDDRKPHPLARYRVHRECVKLGVVCQDWDYTIQSDQDCFRLNMGCTVNSTHSSAMPTLVPRPRPLSPSPITEDAAHFGQEDVLTRRFTNKPVSFFVEFPVGQSPCLAFVGWTTPTFRYVESQFAPPGCGEDEWEEGEVFHSHDHAHYGQFMELSGQRGVKEDQLRTAYMVCLCDLLPSYTQQLLGPVR